MLAKDWELVNNRTSVLVREELMVVWVDMEVLNRVVWKKRPSAKANFRSLITGDLMLGWKDLVEAMES